jgi:maltose/maltodextrin transport system permease protein
MQAVRVQRAPTFADNWGPRALLALVVAGGLYGVVLVHAAGQALLALTLLVTTVAALWVYGSARNTASRYLFPGIAAAMVFVIFPMLYTVSLGFTNYSSTNLLEPEQARAYLLEERTVLPDSAREFTLERMAGDQLRVRLAPAAGGATGSWVSAALALTPAAPTRVEAALKEDEASVLAGPELSLKDTVALLPALRLLTLKAPDGTALELISLREFTVTQPLYQAEADGALTDRLTGSTYRADDRIGFYVSDNGQRLQPGYRVSVGLQHYTRIFTEPRFREPFVSVLVWTVLFSGLTVLGAGALGMLLAVLLNWDGLRGKAVYRTVLFLPYAVPGFISILVFKGLFNQNLGEINLILHGLFGIRPAWFSDPLLAKVMLLVVNIWLGFPYMMVLCSGLIKAIPADLYEASAVVGAGPWTNFTRITLPLILKPLTPLLISAFAFNFNNFVLVSLLTGGRPDQLDTAMPAGTTDILVSYTWRIAFQDSGQQFGLAAAISTVIFLIVAAITLVQMRFTRVAADEPRR